MKLVGGDSGRCEHEYLVEEVVLAPSERVVVDVLFDEPGRLDAGAPHARPHVQARRDVDVTGDRPTPSPAEAFERAAHGPRAGGRARAADAPLDAQPDKTLAFVAEMDLRAAGGSRRLRCPMHPEVVSERAGQLPAVRHEAHAGPPRPVRLPDAPRGDEREPDHCPKCGMKLMPARLVRAPPPAATRAHGARRPRRPRRRRRHRVGGRHGRRQPPTTPANIRWKLVDRSTGAENDDIDWRFRVGDRVKIRLVNEMDSDHPMHHPFHIHGAGRFLVLARDGAVEPNLVWRTRCWSAPARSSTSLLDVTNVGRWMAHCHIAEHHESGMMFTFDVTA